MESLIWSQNADGLHVRVIAPDGRACSFSIANSLINLLLAGTPRIYHVYFSFDGNDIQEPFLLDLTKLRPYIDKTNALRLPLRKCVNTQSYSGISVGKYSLVRGESYHERYLSASGWQYQSVWLDVFLGTPQIVEVPTVVVANDGYRNEPVNTQIPEPVPESDNASNNNADVIILDDDIDF